MEQVFNIGAMKAEAMRKAFSIDLEKGRTGVYEDNAENRRLNRVGQHYGHKKEEEASTGKQPGKSAQPTGQEQKTRAATMASAAQGASDEALKRAVADPKAAPEVKAAAESEIKKRGGGAEDGEKGGKKEITVESLQDCDVHMEEALWKPGYMVHSVFPSIRKIEDNEFMLLELVGNKKVVVDNIKSINKKLGLDLDISQFEHTPRDRYTDNQYAIAYNLKTGEWGKMDDFEKEIEKKKQQDANEKRQEEKKKDGEKNKKRLIEATKSDGLTFHQLAAVLDNDADTREAVLDYFNYDPDWAEENGATEEQLTFCKKLKKMGAKIAPKTFDWKEEEEAKEYENKMRERGYEMFQVYDGDTYVWLAVKSDKLKEDEGE